MGETSKTEGRAIIIASSKRCVRNFACVPVWGDKKSVNECRPGWQHMGRHISSMPQPGDAFCGEAWTCEKESNRSNRFSI